MIRTFHAVGHGGFYTEQFGSVNVIYDCGGKDKDTIKAKIKSTFVKDEIIHALFISHFHRDHINGIEFILEHCDVKKIFLPYLTEEDKVFALLYNHSKKFTGFDELIVDPHDFIHSLSPECQVIMVHSEENKEEVIRVEEELKGPIHSSISSGSVIRYKSWCFVPYNLKYTENRQELINNLALMGIDISSVDKFRQAWSTHKRKVKSCFNRLMDNPNDTSLTLYSGPYIGRFIMDHVGGNLMSYGCYRYPKSNLKAGCLYFGDVNLDENYEDVEEKYMSYEHEVGVVQVPHHGSRHNFHTYLTGINSQMVHIISGEDNHPHCSVLVDILKTYQFIGLVTSDNDTEIKLLIQDV